MCVCVCVFLQDAWQAVGTRGMSRAWTQSSHRMIGSPGLNCRDNSHFTATVSHAIASGERDCLPGGRYSLITHDRNTPFWEAQRSRYGKPTLVRDNYSMLLLCITPSLISPLLFTPESFLLSPSFSPRGGIAMII